MARRLDPAEKVARAAARIVAALPEGTRERAQAIHHNLPGCVGDHTISHGRLLALYAALDEWEASRG